MSIFVLNLATLLGLGLGRGLLAADDQPVPRGAGAPRRTARIAVAEAVRVTVATAGRAVFFSGLTVLLGLLGPGPVRVHDPALGRDRRGDRGRARGRVGADPAAGDPDDPRPAGGPLRGPARSPATPEPDGAVVAARPAGDAPPGRGPRPDARLPAAARLAVPARPVQRPGRHDPAAGGPVARRLRPARSASSARASSRRSSLAIRTDRPGDDAGQPRPRCTTTRAGSPPTRGSPASTASSTSTRA